MSEGEGEEEGEKGEGDARLEVTLWDTKSKR